MEHAEPIDLAAALHIARWALPPLPNPDRGVSDPRSVDGFADPTRSAGEWPSARSSDVALPDEVERLVGLLPDLNAAVSRLRANDALVQVAVGRRLVSMASASGRHDLFALGELVQRAAQVGLDRAVDETAVRLAGQAALDEERLSFDEAMEVAGEAGGRWAAGGWEAMGWLFAALIGRARELARGAEQLGMVGRLQAGVRLRAEGVHHGHVQAVQAWMGLPEWGATWERLADPEHGLLVEPTVVVLRVLTEAFGDRNADDHANLVERALQLRGIGVGDALQQARREHEVLLSARALLAEGERTNAEWLRRCNSQCNEIHDLVERRGAGWLAEAGAAVAEEAAAAARAANDPDLGGMLNNLSIRLSTWVERFGGPRERYPEAVQAAEEAVAAARAANDPRLGGMLNNLSNQLSTWVERFGGPRERYPEAVQAAEEAVAAARAANDPDLGVMLNTLSIRLSTWVERFGGPRERYPEAVQAAEEAVAAARAANDPDLGARLNTLSNQLSTWVQRFGGPRERYPEAVQAAEEAVAAARAANDPDLGGMLNNLSNQLSTWVQRFGGPRERYPEAVQAAEEAVAAARAANDPDLGVMLNTLSIRLSTWVERFGGPRERYPEAVQAAEEAVAAARAANDPRLGGMLNNLSNQLSTWVERFGGPRERYPEAVQAAEEAVAAARAANDPDLGARLNTLSNQLSTWVERFGGPRERYPEAVQAAEEAVAAARAANDPDLGARLNTLSNRLSTWVERFGGPRERYPEAVQAAEEAVAAARAANDPDLGVMLNTLSNRLSTWVERFGGPRERYPEAVQAAEEAVAAARAANDPRLGGMLNNLSIRLSTWVERFGGPRERYPEAVQAAEEAVAAARAANDPDLGGMLNTLSNQLSTWVQRFGGPRERVGGAAREVVEWLVERAAVEPLEELLGDLARDFRDLAARTATALVTAGDLAGAVEALEAVRGLRLGEVAVRSSTLLDQLHDQEPGLAGDYRATVERLRLVEQLATVDPAVRGELVVLRDRLHRLTDRIRARFPGFGRAADLPTLQAALPRANVYLWLWRARPGQLLGVLSGREAVDLVELPVDQAELDTVLAVGQGFPLGPGATNQLGLTDIDLGQPEPDRGAISAAFMNALVESLLASCRFLWDAIARPVVAQLPDDATELTIIPVGALAVLPLHAAGSGTDWLIDRVAVRYAITATSLLLPDGADRPVPDGPILQPEPVSPQLPCARHEARILSAITGRATQTTTCTQQQVAALLRTATWFHTSSHLTADPNAHSTALQLVRGEAFTVADCERLPHLPRAEAFIAACSGKTPGLELPDEVIGFPNALLATGFERVLSVAWQINDLAACLQAVHYHRRRVDHPEESAAAALRGTQLWLRDMSPDEIAVWFDELGVAYPAARRYATGLARALRTLPAGFFSHPVHWAAITVTGR